MVSLPSSSRRGRLLAVGVLCALLALGLARHAAPSARADIVGTGIAAERVFDPKLEGASLAIESQLASGGSYQARVSVLDASGRLIRTVGSGTRSSGRTYTDTWTGHDGRGVFVPPGRYTLRFEAGGGVVRETTVNVVRLGLLAMAFRDSPNGIARIPLAYHRADRFTAGNPFAVDSAGPPWVLDASPLGWDCLDAADGSPLPVPAPWTDTASPPRTSNGSVATRGVSYPIAYPGGARPRVIFMMGGSAGYQNQRIGCGYPIQGTPIRGVLGRWASRELSPGETGLLEVAELASGLRREELQLSFRFQYNDGSGWRWVPGQVRTRHDLYVTAGAPDTPDGRALVGALDLARQFAPGARTRTEVASGVVRGINGGRGFVYEDRQGAPAYTDAPNGLHWPEIGLGAFIDRRWGQRVNCLDCAASVGSLTRHAGVGSVSVVVMGWNFDLNWIRGIGGRSFRHDLFGGAHAFSYHAVASVDRGSTVHDACLSVDADSRPDRSPFQEGEATGMGWSRYRGQLSFDRWYQIQDIGSAILR